MTEQKTLNPTLDLPPTAFEGARLLLVDDEPKNLRLLEALLAPCGYYLSTATSGEECLKAVSQNLPDLLLLDVMMPGMDGYEVTRRLRSDDTTRLLPIVIVSALSDVQDRVRGIEEGCDDFISKPFNKDEILAKVQTTLRLSYYRRQLDEREKFDALVSRVSEAIVVASEAWKVSRLNENAAGLLPDTEIGDNLLDSIFAQYEVSVPQEELLRADDARKNFFLTRSGSNGAPLYLHCCMDVLTGRSGDASSVVLTMRDMTREQLEQRQKETFLNRMSDKLRVPLADLSRSLNQLQNGSLGEVSPAQNRALDDMAHEALALSSVVSKLARFSVVNSLSIINSRTLDLPREKIDLATELKPIVDAAVHYAGHPTVETHFDPTPSDASVAMSRVYFELMIQDLVDNAVKFCDREPLKLGITVTKKDSHVTIAFADNGPGVPHSEQQRIFEAFYQIDEGPGVAPAGAGLGLALVKRLAEAYGGSVSVRSKSGEGATFSISLPES